VVLAAFYAQQEPPTSPADLRRAQVEEQDRQFLASLGQPVVPTESADRADRDFLAKLQAEDRRSAKQEMPVLRAIPIEPALPVARVSAPVLVRDLPGEMPEVRRAVAVVRVSSSTSTSGTQNVRTATAVSSSSTSSAKLRNTLQDPYATLGAPEIRRSASEGRRASIVIHGDQVVLR
jgi:hypothetical protein